VPPPAESHRPTWTLLADVYQGVLRPVVDRLEAEGGIDSGAYTVLAYLARSETPGRLPLADLQRLMRVRYSQPGLSRLVQRMETAGLIRRDAHPTDRRSTIVVTTRLGATRYRRAERVYDAALEAEFGRHLDQGDADHLADLLGEIVRRRGDTPGHTPSA
jgi:DNA-binding MarR family transcriptional regulator